MDGITIKLLPIEPGRCFNQPRARTYCFCPQCGILHGPIGHLREQFCSQACAYAFRVMAPEDRKPRSKRTRAAINASSLVAYHVKAGNMSKPDQCQECGAVRKLEAAHHDYSKPLDVRWLCVPCHRRWDWAEPKGGVAAA